MYSSSKGKPRVFSTYSKRKQFVRIVRDQWKDINKKDSFDNVFDIPQPNTSTPLHQCTIPKSSPVLCTSSEPSPDLKPVNLGMSGLFDDTPLERRKNPAKDITDLRRVLSISNNQNCSKSKIQLIPPNICKNASLRSSNVSSNDNSNNSSRSTRSQGNITNQNSSQNVSKNRTKNTNVSKLSQKTQNTSKLAQNTSRQISSKRVTRSLSASQSMFDSCSIHTSMMSTNVSASLSESLADRSAEVAAYDSSSNVPTQVPINISSDTSTDESLLIKPLDDEKENSPLPDTNDEESLHSKLYSGSSLSPILDNSQSLFSTVANSYQLPLNDSYTGLIQPPANCVDVSMASSKEDVSMASLNEDVSVMSIKDNVSMKEDNMSIVQDVSVQIVNINPVKEKVSIIKEDLSITKPKDVSIMLLGSPFPTKDMSVLEAADEALRVCNLDDEVIHPVLQGDDPLNTSTRRSVLLDTSTPALIKLRDQCTVVTRIEHMFDNSRLAEFRKIGEGCFGEVYMDDDTVYKVVPVGGDVVINESEQTSYDNALQEILVSKMLSDLSGDEVQMGKAFCQLKGVIMTCGVYPEMLLQLWDQYNERRVSDNERPDVFPANQRYVILLSKYSGVQLEDYCTDNKLTPDQAHSIVRQCCCSLAAAEKQYEFEHRDLHWGNVLIERTSTELVDFTADGQEFILRSHGLLATIIDFTFSRLETEGCLNFVDLENEDWLFEGDEKVDIQFRVYRDMRRACRKNWAKFTPKTNVQWLAYLIDKMNIKIKSKKLKNLKDLIGNKKSAAEALPFIMRSL